MACVPQPHDDARCVACNLFHLARYTMNSFSHHRPDCPLSWEDTHTVSCMVFSYFSFGNNSSWHCSSLFLSHYGLLLSLSWVFLFVSLFFCFLSWTSYRIFNFGNQDLTFLEILCSLMPFYNNLSLFHGWQRILDVRDFLFLWRLIIQLIQCDFLLQTMSFRTFLVYLHAKMQ